MHNRLRHIPSKLHGWLNQVRLQQRQIVRCCPFPVQRSTFNVQRSAFNVQRSEGQSLVFFALVLACAVPFIFGIVEFSERQLEVAQMQDALQQAARASVQLLDYAALAENNERIDEARVQQVATQTFAQNLGTVHGLSEPVETLVNRVTWTILPQGGTCRFAGLPAQTFVTPVVCAEVRPVLTGFALLGYAPYQPQITAASTLDRVER